MTINCAKSKNTQTLTIIHCRTSTDTVTDSSSGTWHTHIHTRTRRTCARLLPIASFAVKINCTLAFIVRNCWRAHQNPLKQAHGRFERCFQTAFKLNNLKSFKFARTAVKIKTHYTHACRIQSPYPHHTHILFTSNMAHSAIGLYPTIRLECHLTLCSHIRPAVDLDADSPSLRRWLRVAYLSRHTANSHDASFYFRRHGEYHQPAQSHYN